MYGKLWNFVNQYIDKEHALAVYLPILIVGWTIIGTVLGMGSLLCDSNQSCTKSVRYRLRWRICRDYIGAFRRNPLLVPQIKI